MPFNVSFFTSRGAIRDLSEADLDQIAALPAAQRAIVQALLQAGRANDVTELDLAAHDGALKDLYRAQRDAQRAHEANVFKPTFHTLWLHTTKGISPTRDPEMDERALYTGARLVALGGELALARDAQVAATAVAKVQRGVLANALKAYHTAFTPKVPTRMDLIKQLHNEPPAEHKVADSACDRAAYAGRHKPSQHHRDAAPGGFRRGATTTRGLRIAVPSER